MGALGIMMLRRGTMANPIAGSDYILSETQGDPEVFRILMEKGVSSDGVGITKDDAAKVTTISNWFTGNANIESFDEFKFFTGVTRLGADVQTSGSKDAFANCVNLKSVELPSSLLYIGTFGFFNCTGLKKVLMPSSIRQIGAGAFQKAAAPLIIDLPELQSLPRFSDVNISYTFRASGVTRIENLGSVAQTYGRWDGTATNRYGVFHECANLEYADVRNLSIMGACMFAGCSMLREVIMEKVTEVGGGAFISCAALETLRFPSTLSKMSDYSVGYCNNLQTLIVEATTPPTIKSNSISDLPLLSSIYVPDASVSAYKSANTWKTWASIIKPLSEYNG